MLEIPVSPELMARLTGKVHGHAAGTAGTQRIGDDGSAGKSAPRHQLADPGEVCQPMSMRQGRVIRERPFLMLIEGGLA